MFHGLLFLNKLILFPWHPTQIYEAICYLIIFKVPTNHSCTKDDYELLQKGMIIYDALYSCTKYRQKEKHTSTRIKHLFMNTFINFSKQKNHQGKKDLNGLRN
jgi:prolipoprotein diacylglyceryltransferase